MFKQCKQSGLHPLDCFEFRSECYALNEISKLYCIGMKPFLEFTSFSRNPNIWNTHERESINAFSNTIGHSQMQFTWKSIDYPFDNATNRSHLMLNSSEITNESHIFVIVCRYFMFRKTNSSALWFIDSWNSMQWKRDNLTWKRSWIISISHRDF